MWNGAARQSYQRQNHAGTIFGAVGPILYGALIGKQVRLPLVGRLIPIVADDHADPEKGTGAVKITPAHDPNDFEVGRRHKLPEIDVMTDDGHMSAAAGA